MHRPLAAAIWLAFTVTATIIVWAAVSVVAADVTDRPAPVVAHRDVVVALGAGTTPPPVAPTTATTAPPRTAPPAIAVPATPSPTPTRPTARVPVAPPATAGNPEPTTTTSTTKPPAHPVAPPPTTVAPPNGTATYSTDGGYVGVACTGFNTIRLVAAQPNDGFQAVVVSPGPYGVQVNFVGQGRNIGVSAACVFGQPFEYTNPKGGPPGT